VLNINPKERRIGLSIKQLEVDEEHELVTDYLSSYDGPTSSLGELLKENLKDKAAPVESEETTEASDEEMAASEDAMAEDQDGETMVADTQAADEIGEGETPNDGVGLSEGGEQPEEELAASEDEAQPSLEDATESSESEEKKDPSESDEDSEKAESGTEANA
jgi:small subunit ribosomal protein S1